MTKASSDVKQRIVSTLNLFPEVVWDRWSGSLEYASIFGWIRRKDGLYDFMVLDFDNGEPVALNTSSAKYSAEFAVRLGFTHDDCRRVEHDFEGVACIMLASK